MVNTLQHELYVNLQLHFFVLVSFLCIKDRILLERVELQNFLLENYIYTKYH